MSPSLGNSFWFAILMIGILTFGVGCNQHRYKPAKRRAAVRKTTLPVSETVANDGTRWSSLPMARRLGTLPFRNGLGSTLPGGRGFGGTLPMRNWSTLPKNWSTLPGRIGAGGLSTLPGREPYPGYRRAWSTLPGRGGVNGMGTLPQRRQYLEDRFQLRNWSTIPSRGGVGGLNTLPQR